MKVDKHASWEAVVLFDLSLSDGGNGEEKNRKRDFQLPGPRLPGPPASYNRLMLYSTP